MIGHDQQVGSSLGGGVGTGGMDAGSGLVHTMTVTAANAHDVTQTANLLREDDEVVYGDSGYFGVQKRPEIASNEHFSQIDFRINRRPR